MTGEKSLFYELDESFKGKVGIGDDSKINIEERGKMLLNLNLDSLKLLSSHDMVRGLPTMDKVDKVYLNYVQLKQTI